MLDRLRQARAVEDTALATVAAAHATVDAAAAKRADVLAALDATVAEAQAQLARARAELVDAAGLDRAALALGLTNAALRKSLPTGERAKARNTASGAVIDADQARLSAGGER